MTVTLSVPKEQKEQALTAVFDADGDAHWNGENEITSAIVAAVYDEATEALTLTATDDEWPGNPGRFITDPAAFCGLSDFPLKATAKAKGK
jgi:hypothetical protein